MDSPEFKPFELKDFDSEVSVQDAAVEEADGFKPMNYSAGTVIHRFETVCFFHCSILDGYFAVEIFQFEGFELRAVHGGWTCG